MGQNRLRLDANGNLIVSIAAGEIIEHKPALYQDIARQDGQCVNGKDEGFIGLHSRSKTEPSQPGDVGP